MFRGRVSSWNLRDTHMMETLRALLVYFAKRVPQPRVVIWAHNSHLGDARYTEMGERGELNLGELVREDFGHNAVLIGFTTYTGTVTAASDWGAPAEHKRVRPALRVRPVRATAGRAMTIRGRSATVRPSQAPCAGLTARIGATAPTRTSSRESPKQRPIACSPMGRASADRPALVCRWPRRVRTRRPIPIATPTSSNARR